MKNVAIGNWCTAGQCDNPSRWHSLNKGGACDVAHWANYEVMIGNPRTTDNRVEVGIY